MAMAPTQITSVQVTKPSTKCVSRSVCSLFFRNSPKDSSFCSMSRRLPARLPRQPGEYEKEKGFLCNCILHRINLCKKAFALFHYIIKVDCSALHALAITTCIRNPACRPTCSYRLARPISMCLRMQACSVTWLLSGTFIIIYREIVMNV